MATYGPGIDQSQHAKSVSHIINALITYFLGQPEIKGFDLKSLSHDELSSVSTVQT